MSEPTHVLPHFNSCLDLIFTNQPNVVADRGTYSSLNSKFHHQITHCRLDSSWSREDEIYNQLEENYVLPEKQKGCLRNSRVINIF